jgi:uncharacterized protein YifN (PemK superfamily)
MPHPVFYAQIVKSATCKMLQMVSLERQKNRTDIFSVMLPRFKHKKHPFQKAIYLSRNEIIPKTKNL